MFYSIFLDIHSILFLFNGRLEEAIMKFLFVIITLAGTFFWFMLGYKMGLKNGLWFLGIAIPCFMLYLTYNNFLFGINYLVSSLLLLPQSGGFSIIGNIFGFLVKKHTEAGFSRKSAVQISIVLSVLIFSFLIELILGLHNPSIRLAFIMFGVIGTDQLRTMEIRQRKKLINEYRKSEPRRIQP
jgi:hypothetical protein